MREKGEGYRVRGFLANGIAAGIKKDGGRDLALIYSEKPACADGVFTANTFKAAPVILARERIKNGYAQAIVVNSGNANAATGAEGYDRACAMSRAVSTELKIKDDLVLTASTGVIGVPLPVHKIEASAGSLVSGLKEEGIEIAEEAIMTTDRFPKLAREKFVVGGKEVTICGMAKGAGMIEPNMATMLAFILTDLNVRREILAPVFREVADLTFNAITVDGCMSTNDTAIIMASGFAGNKEIVNRRKEAGIFKEKLHRVMSRLAKEIVRDGEGATRVMEIAVTSAASRSEARKAAYAIANSNLVKTAFFGGDPNWGRIISALGSLGLPLSVSQVEVALEGTPIFKNGGGITANEEAVARVMQQDSIRVEVDLARGTRAFTVYASDLTFDYVKINAHYRT